MPTLAEALKHPTKRQQIIDDCAKLIDAEVADKRGLSGKIVKVTFKSIRSFKPGFIPGAVDGLIDNFATAIEPFWDECTKSNAEPKNFLSKRKLEIANALLKITDERASNSPHRTLVKGYKALRGKAVDHISTSIPRLAELLKKHAT